MRRALKGLGIAVGLAVAGVLLYAAVGPDSFRIARTTTIAAPPEKIYPHIADLRAWSAWSPYEKKDPAMKRTFSERTQGPGATYAWEGNGEVGTGRMQIAETIPPRDLRIKLDFEEPIKASNVAEFTLRPHAAGGTQVTWSMRGPQPFTSRLVGVFIDIEDMVGRDFEAGLASLKSIVEH